jgi:hypothetical protein
MLDFLYTTQYVESIGDRKRLFCGWQGAICSTMEKEEVVIA